MARELTYTIKVLSDQAEEKVRRVEQAMKNAATAASGGGNSFEKAEREVERAIKDADRSLDKLNVTLAKQKDGLAGVDRQTQTLLGTVQKIGGALGIAFSVQSIISFGKSIADDASKIQDLHQATGIASTNLQKLGYVGKDVGVDMNEMGRAVLTLSDRLAGGDQSAVDAVKELGLSVNDLRRAGPLESFLQLADAAGKVEDPMEKARIASDLFGERLGKNLIPMLGNLRQAMNDVPKGALIADDDIRAIDEASEAYDHLVTKLKAYVATRALALFKPTREDWEKMAGTDFANAMANKDRTDIQLPAGLPVLPPGVVEGYRQGADAVDDIHAAFQKFADGQAVAALKKHTAEVDRLNASVRSMRAGLIDVNQRRAQIGRAHV